MRPVRIPDVSLQIVVLPLHEAEARGPVPGEGAVSITGGDPLVWRPAEFPEGAFDSGVVRVAVDDIGSGLTADAQAALLRGFREAVALARSLAGRGTPDNPSTLVLHCLAGRSRSTAFAMGIAAALGGVVAVPGFAGGLAMAFAERERQMQPNPLFLSMFERELGLPEDWLARALRPVAPDFVTWERYWRRKEGGPKGVTALAALLLAAALSAAAPTALAQDPSASLPPPCGRESRPPPECGMDINSASLEALAAIPGMTRVEAERIVAGRPWVRVSEPMERGAISTVTWDGVRAYAYVLRVSVNHATAAEIAARSGIGAERAARVVSGRPWTALDDLARSGILSPMELDRIRPLLALR